MRAELLDYFPDREDLACSRGWGAPERDALTGLASLPWLIKVLAKSPALGLTGELVPFLAIGDVDGLRHYIAAGGIDDVGVRGHLAASRLVRAMGIECRKWLAMSQVENVCIASFGGDEILICALERSGIESQGMASGIRELQAHLAKALPLSVSFSATRACVEAYAVCSSLWADMLHKVDLDLVQRKADASRADVPFLAYLETVRA